MFNKGESDFPRLSGKGAEVRRLATPLMHVFASHIDHSNKVHKQIRLVLQFSCGLEDTLDEHAHEFVVPDAAAKAFETK
eukprot:922955-Alexandrium_andersonii.AAC.1